MVEVNGASPAKIGATIIVLITEDHAADEAALRALIESPAPYIGMIRSRRKCGTVLDHLRADRVAKELLTRVRAPIGLDLGGTTPAEVALAICGNRNGSAPRLRHAHLAETRHDGQQVLYSANPDCGVQCCREIQSRFERSVVTVRPSGRGA